ncbi:MAG: hypothetical protein ACHREM_27130, partial [Polyangiales bacterium]
MRVLASVLLVVSLGSLALVAADRAEAAGFACGSGKPNPTTGKCDCSGGQTEKTQGGVSRCVAPEWKPPAQCPIGQKKDDKGKCVAVAKAAVTPTKTPTITCPDKSHLVGSSCVGDVACLPGTHFVVGDGCVVDGSLPQTCGLPVGKAEYGGLKEGSRVVLGKHRAVDGEENWAAEMEPYVGLTSKVKALSDVDAEGCACVQVEADAQTYYWRVRDMKVAPTTYPQACGVKTATTSDYGVQLGWQVVLSHHRAVDGDEYWASEMDKFVGKTTEVKEFGGVDPKGCPVVRVEADKRAYYWRVRDLTPATTIAPAEVVPTPTVVAGSHDFEQACAQKSATVRYGLTKGDTVVLGKHRAYD